MALYGDGDLVILYSNLLVMNIILQFVFLWNFRALWPLLLLYWSFIFLDRSTPFTGGTDRLPFSLLHTFPLWDYFTTYFNATLVKTAELDPNGRYIFAYHPHGIFCYGLLPNFVLKNRFPKMFGKLKVRLTTLDLNFWLPVWREISMGFGTTSVSARGLKNLLTKVKGGKGVGAVIVVGGADEALLSYPGKNDIILNKRKGFIKLAIQTGSSLVPTYTFGENDMFYQVTKESFPFLYEIQQELRKYLTFALPIYWGRYGLLFPRRVRLTTVVGRPIHVPQNPEPSREEVDKVHAEYTQALVELYTEWKGDYGDGADMKIVA
ncbi:diacylglycerol acyltransferase [Gaertneriomyces semiglobifer]|nr:diacylglycerol acyltransferase [Gaertneriomyces semiglobifer]